MKPVSRDILIIVIIFPGEIPATILSAEGIYNDHIIQILKRSPVWQWHEGGLP